MPKKAKEASYKVVSFYVQNTTDDMLIDQLIFAPIATLFDKEYQCPIVIESLVPGVAIQEILLHFMLSDAPTMVNKIYLTSTISGEDLDRKIVVSTKTITGSVAELPLRLYAADYQAQRNSVKRSFDNPVHIGRFTNLYINKMYPHERLNFQLIIE